MIFRNPSKSKHFCFFFRREVFIQKLGGHTEFPEVTYIIIPEMQHTPGSQKSGLCLCTVTLRRGHFYRYWISASFMSLDTPISKTCAPSPLWWPQELSIVHWTNAGNQKSSRSSSPDISNFIIIFNTTTQNRYFHGMEPLSCRFLPQEMLWLGLQIWPHCSLFGSSLPAF